MVPFLVQQIGFNALLSLGLLAGDARLQALLSLLGLSLQAGLRIIDGLLQGLDLTVKSELDTEANAKAAKDGITWLQLKDEEIFDEGLRHRSTEPSKKTTM